MSVKMNKDRIPKHWSIKRSPLEPKYIVIKRPDGLTAYVSGDEPNSAANVLYSLAADLLGEVDE